MIFNRIKIIEAGPTPNEFTAEVPGSEEPKTGKLVITPASLDSLVKLGNEKPIHCRKTHNGMDMLDQYIGKFTNFVREGDTVYADLTISPAMEEAYPAEVKFITGMIEKEPEMLGVSIVDLDVKMWNEETGEFEVTEFTELFTCDLVGLPAATSSLFNNQKSSNKMGAFSSIVSAFSKKKSKFAEQTVETVNGEKIVIRTAGEEAEIGDEVVMEDGTPHADGEVVVDLKEEGKLVIVVKDGKIEEFKEFQEEVVEEEKREETRTPDEFSKRLDAIETTLGEIKTSLSKQTKTPATFRRNDSKVEKPEKKSTELSRDEARKAANEAMKKYAKMK